jgi:hypothetical protein
MRRWKVRHWRIRCAVQHQGLFRRRPREIRGLKANGMPFFLGGVFLAMGSVVLLVGLFMDIVLVITAL